MGLTPDHQRALRHQNIGRLFLQAQRDYQRRALQKLHALGYSALSPAHITVLSQLAEQATRTVVLAERVGITKQSMSDLVRDLEAHGYVARTADPREPNILYVAWRGDQDGRALRWWIEELKKKRLADRLVRGMDRFV